jgi:DNA polymerase III gamma/tau subunit
MLETIKGRCSVFQMKPLEQEEMIDLLVKIVTREEQEVDIKILEIIARDSLGRPRNAINILEQVLQAPEEKRLKVAERVAEEQAQGIELCRALIKRAPWGVIAKILVGLKDQEAESIRRMVLGYMQSVLLKTDNSQAAFVLEEFIEPFYDSGFPQLVHACYIVTKK